MLKAILGHMGLSPIFLLHDWGKFFAEEYHKVLILHALVIIGSYVINIFGYFSQWQISLTIILLRKFLSGGVFHSKKYIFGKLVIVTGACSGIGKETTKELAMRGATVIMACCDMKRAHQVSEELRSETGGDITVMELDLSSLKSVRSFVKEFKREHDVLHILINNAGVMMCPYMTTEDGFEMQFGVNHLGHFLLTNLLLPTMTSAPDPRIINVSSIMHLVASIDLNNLNDEKQYNPVRAYSNSKLANILFSLALSERLKETKVQVCAVHPGVVQSRLGKYLPFGGALLYANLLSLVFKSSNQGVQTTLYCVLEADSLNGCYYSDCGVGTPTTTAKDRILASNLWQISENLVDLKRNNNELLSFMKI